MQQLITCILFLCLAHTIAAQPKKKVPVRTQQTISFPQSFIGKWKGTLTWTVAGKAPQAFTMRLNILPADSGRYTWQIIYGDDEKDNRPYILQAADTAKGHWVVDEKNSIVLDSYWIGNRFTGAFAVQNSTIVDQYWLEADGLHVEFLTYATKPIATTGGTSADIPPVDSYEIRSVQRGVLKRVK
jgi:hypothetical protein